MMVTGNGPRGVTVAFYRGGQVYGGQKVPWPDDKPPPPWSVEGAKARAKAKEAKAPGVEVVESISTLGDLTKAQLKAFIAARGGTVPDEPVLKADLVALAGQLAGAQAEGEEP